MSRRVCFRLEVKGGLLNESGLLKTLRVLRLGFGTGGYGFIDRLSNLLNPFWWILRLFWGSSEKDDSGHRVLSQIAR